MPKAVAFNSIEDFLNLVEPKLLRREAENSLMLGLCRSMASFGSLPVGVQLIAVVKDGIVQTAAVQTPPYNMIISQSDQVGLDVLTRFIVSEKISVPGVVGPEIEAVTFSKLYSSRMPVSVQLGMDQRIYEATSIRTPNIDGTLEVAQEEHTFTVGQWLYEFSSESLPKKEKFSLDYAQEWAKKAIAEKSAYLWLNQAGMPVSVAHTGRPTRNGISIRAVYTPTMLRKNGFASAVVAGVSRRMLESGYKFCCLYTDASNPTSNKIYEAIGYKKIANSNHFIFSK